jgi:hypothetical protein
VPVAVFGVIAAVNINGDVPNTHGLVVDDKFTVPAAVNIVSEQVGDVLWASLGSPEYIAVKE